MANLTHENGMHETESPESRWAQKFYRAFIRASTELNIQGFDMGENYYQFNDGDKKVTIKFIFK